MGKLEDKIIQRFRSIWNPSGPSAKRVGEIIESFLRQELSSYRREIEKEVEELAVDGLLTDGGHHKQWYLEKILKVIGVDLIKLRKELNTPNKKGDYWDWEDGIAP